LSIESQTSFIHDLNWDDIPITTQSMVRRCLLDLLGVAASGTSTSLSTIIRQHSISQFGSQKQSARLLFDGRHCSATGAALANGMTIDSVDAHDGFKPVKGHAGCGVIAGLLALHELANGEMVSERELLTGIAIGYEVACRAGDALHQSVSDYHTSGAWVSLAVAALGARILKLNIEETRHALGIAEYHGPRSQMMRCIDHPTMLKDGSGWGSMAGVSAALLAKEGFTGAPAITVEADDQMPIWQSLGKDWLIEQQYFKPFPVCRWAQSAAIAALNLKEQHQFDAKDIKQISIGSFHESVRLATTLPQSTEEAQYSLPFPVATALINNKITIDEIDGAGLTNESVRHLSQSISLYEVDDYNSVFPQKRISEVSITLTDGRTLESGPTEANGDPEFPLDDKEIDEKFSLFAEPILGTKRSRDLQTHIHSMGAGTDLRAFNSLIYTAPGDTEQTP